MDADESSQPASIAIDGNAEKTAKKSAVRATQNRKRMRQKKSRR
jgi:hypothetical protein